MKKLNYLLMVFAAPFLFAQQAGDVVNVEQKLNLTPDGTAEFIANGLGTDVPAPLKDFLKGFKIGLKAYKITYYTNNQNNVLVKATGLLMYPDRNYKLSTIVTDHGTTDYRQNVPSNLKGIMQVGFALELAYALNGYIVMAPDYQGMGTGDGTHMYVNYITEANATIDFVTAAKTVLNQQAVKQYDEYFLTGYSQGAHAAMSTLKRLSISNPTNLKFKYAFLGAGPYDLSESTMKKSFLEKSIYSPSAFLANVINSCNNTGYQTYSNDISEVISPEYLDKYNYHVVQDNGGMLWGPIIWRNLFTSNFINEATNNPNSTFKKCLKSNDVYDWNNRTPTTLGHSNIDNIVAPENTSKAFNTQRSYFSWWDLNKFKLQSLYWGPLDHGGGVVPFVLASNAMFNTLRSGGIFNQWAMLTSKQAETSTQNEIPLYSSQIKPDLGNIKLLEITDINTEKATKRSMPEQNINTLKDGVYLLKVSDHDEIKMIPYIKRTPQEVDENEIAQSENNDILKLRIDSEEITGINIFDENKNIVKNVSKEQYKKNNGINLNNLDSKKYTFEVVTPYYNLQFNKTIKAETLEVQTDIFTKNRQIMARSADNIKNISIYSISGALVSEQNVNKSQFESKNLESGIYIVQMTLSNGKVVNKKVKL